MDLWLQVMDRTDETEKAMMRTKIAILEGACTDVAAQLADILQVDHGKINHAPVMTFGMHDVVELVHDDQR